jgi:outer membrane protein assembly factor BamB
MALDFGAGPHSTPLVAGNRVFTIGAMVQLQCREKKTGKLVWRHDLMDEMGANHCYRGYGASPIAYKNTVIVNVGGREVGLAAFDQETGEVVWKSERFAPSVVSPILARINDEDHLITGLRTDRLGLDPATGAIRWKATVEQDMPAMMSTPLMVAGNRVFYTAAYGCGSRVFEITCGEDGYKAQELWHNRHMRVQHGNVVQIGDHVFGTSGDFGDAILTALNVKTGKVAWRKRGFPKSTILLADGKLLILDEDGRLTLATATPKGLEVHAQAKVLNDDGHHTWTAPTLVGTRLYLRDFYQIRALDLSAAGNS